MKRFMGFSSGYKSHIMTLKDVRRASKDVASYFIAVSSEHKLQRPTTTLI